MGGKWKREGGVDGEEGETMGDARAPLTRVVYFRVVGDVKQVVV